LRPRSRLVVCVMRPQWSPNKAREVSAMEAMEEFGRFGKIVPLRQVQIPFEIAADELSGWELPTDVPMASADEIEGDLALGHPAWGSLMRVTE